MTDQEQLKRMIIVLKLPLMYEEFQSLKNIINSKKTANGVLGFWGFGVSMVFQGGFMVFGRFPWLMVPGWLNPS